MKAYDEALRAEQCVVSGGSAYAQSNLPQENALSQPAADINYESKATPVPPALPVWCWEALRGWLGRNHGEATDVAHTFLHSRKQERLWLYSDLFAAGGLVRAEPLKVWIKSLHAINHSCPRWSRSMCSAKDLSASTPMIYSCNIAYSIL